MLRVQLINPVFEANFLRGGRNRLVVQAEAIQAQQIGLNADRVLGSFPLQELNTLLAREVRSIKAQWRYSLDVITIYTDPQACGHSLASCLQDTGGRNFHRPPLISPRYGRVS